MIERVQASRRLTVRRVEDDEVVFAMPWQSRTQAFDKISVRIDDAEPEAAFHELHRDRLKKSALARACFPDDVDVTKEVVRENAKSPAATNAMVKTAEHDGSLVRVELHMKVAASLHRRALTLAVNARGRHDSGRRVGRGLVLWCGGSPAERRQRSGRERFGVVFGCVRAEQGNGIGLFAYDLPDRRKQPCGVIGAHLGRETEPEES